MRKQHNADIQIADRSRIAANPPLTWKPNSGHGIKKKKKE